MFQPEYFHRYSVRPLHTMEVERGHEDFDLYLPYTYMSLLVITGYQLNLDYRPLSDFFNSVLRPFQDYFISYETGQSVGGRKRENPDKKHLTHPQAELGLACLTCGLEPTPDTTVR